jgi:hypothetical protein
LDVAETLSFYDVSPSGREKGLPGPNLESKGDAGSHRSIWKQETASHSTRGERVRCHVTASSFFFSELLVSDTAHASVQIPSPLVTVHCGAFRNKFAVGNSGSIEKNDQHCLDTRFLQPDFLLPGRIHSTPSHALPVSDRIENFFTSYNYLQHVTIETATSFNPMLSLFSR